LLRSALNIVDDLDHGYERPFLADHCPMRSIEIDPEADIARS
jgi:hypothetical protein